MDFFDALSGIAEALGAGEAIKKMIPGVDAYADGRATQTDADGNVATPRFSYERVLTRQRELTINDR